MLSHWPSHTFQVPVCASEIGSNALEGISRDPAIDAPLPAIYMPGDVCACGVCGRARDDPPPRTPGDAYCSVVVLQLLS